MKTSRAAGRIWLKDNLNDTLYTISRDDRLVPAFVFDLGRYASQGGFRDIGSDRGVEFAGLQRRHAQDHTDDPIGPGRHGTGQQGDREV